MRLSVLKVEYSPPMKMICGSRIGESISYFYSSVIYENFLIILMVCVISTEKAVCLFQRQSILQKYTTTYMTILLVIKNLRIF